MTNKEIDGCASTLFLSFYLIGVVVFFIVAIPKLGIVPSLLSAPIWPMFAIVYVCSKMFE